MTAQVGRIMRRSYAGVSKLRRRHAAASGTVIAMSLNVHIDHCRRAWESPLQTRHEHGRYDGRVQATLRCPGGPRALTDQEWIGRLSDGAARLG